MPTVTHYHFLCFTVASNIVDGNYIINSSVRIYITESCAFAKFYDLQMLF